MTNQTAISGNTADIAKQLVEGGEFSLNKFFRYWGELDDGYVSQTDSNKTKGFPSVGGGDDATGGLLGGLMPSSLSGAVSSVTTLASSIPSGISNIAASVGLGSSGTATGDAEGAVDALRGIGGF